MKRVNLAIVGATGMVGRTILEVLEERDFPIDDLYLFASARSKGTSLEYGGKEYIVEELTEESFKSDIDIALFSAGGQVSKKFAPLARDNGVTVVDNSSAWRMEEDIPLIVPEVNPEDIEGHQGIIANPNCSTIQAVLPLKMLDEAFGIKRVVYSTYQAVSGSGMAGVEDLKKGLKGQSNEKYPHQIANNCLPHIDVFMENGYTKEEMKMIQETRKILNRQDLKVTATTVRIPVENCHSISTNIEFEKPFKLSEIYDIFGKSEGIILQDKVEENMYPTPLQVTGNDEVYIGRIRRDFSLENGLNLWVVADNIRKGAATNTIQIAELLIKGDLV